MPLDTRIAKRHAVIALWKQGRLPEEAARMVGLAPGRGVFWVERFKQTGDVSDAPRSGRPATVSAAAAAAAQAHILGSQSVRLTTNQLKQEGTISQRTSPSTIFRHLSTGPGAVKCKGVTKVPPMTPKTMTRRLEFARHHLRHKTSWHRVLFVDSKYFYVSLKGTRKVWVLAGAKAQQPAFKRGAGLHVYGAFSAAGTLPLVVATGTARYQFKKGQRGVTALEYQHILREHLLPGAKRLFKGKRWQLLHDGAKPHTAKETKAFLKRKVQVVAKWPANSPDLNPIENLWSWVQRQVNKTPVTNVAELQATVFKAWSQIPSSLLQQYAASMERRLQKVKAGKGAYTGY